VKFLVDRFGRTGAALITSVIWALPLAAWAGSADLSPIDHTAYPSIALTIGLAMLAVWLFILTRIARVDVETRRRRLDLAQMSPPEKRWALVWFACVCGAIAWLNAAATVDWQPLIVAVRAGEAKAIVLTAVLALFLLAMLAGATAGWRRWAQAYARRP
jgi:hypothetical protein